MLLIVLLSGVLALPVADSLFGRGLYHDAATEFRRHLYEHPGDAPASTGLKLGLALGASGDIRQAAEVLRHTAESYPDLRFGATMALAGFLSDRRDIESASLELSDLLAFTQDSSCFSDVASSLGWLSLKQGLVREAADHLARVGRDSLAREVKALARQPRNPSTALLLSSVIPGMGEIYAGHTASGLASLFVTAGAAAGTYWAASSDDWVTATIVFSVFFLRFYNGSRQSALAFAESRNQEWLQTNVDRVLASRCPEPDWFRAAFDAAGLRRPASFPEPVPGTASERAPLPACP